jgi:predicted dehydrogenase
MMSSDPSHMIYRRQFIGTLFAGATLPLFAETTRLRVGQIGTAHAHASGKMEAVRSLPDLFEVVGVTSAQSIKNATYEGIPHLSESELLSREGLRAVLVETSVEESCAAALRALRAGKHVHLDKPGALEHAEFASMRREAEALGLTVQMGYMLRYNPAFELLFKAHSEGWLGEILEIDAAMGKLAEPATRHTIGGLPGGGMFELACHVIDATVTLLGRPSEVHAFSTPTRPADGVKDNQLAVLVYPKSTVTIRCNHADPFGGPRRRFLVTGSRGALEIQPLESGKATLSLTQDCGPWKRGTQSVALPVGKGRYTGEFMDLARVLRGEKKLGWDATHDITVHETVLKAAGV